jgi:1,5-anhydro-D-fructose reductase (1,5-anhydro-D-mannitol-forming)
MTALVGWGLVGASNIARQRVANAINRSDEGRVVGVMSHSRALAEAFADEFEIPHYYDSLPDLLAQPRVTAVYISSTNQYHHEQVLAAAAAGKHVLCEKPLATDLDDAIEMVRACRAAGVIMGTNHHLRSSVTIRAMRAAMANGRIGTPVSAIVSQPVFVGEKEWRRDTPAAGSGVSFDVLVHSADAIRYILGQEPVEVCAMGRSSTSMANGVNDSIMATYLFHGGVLASLYADFNVAHGRTRIEIHGRDGSIFGSDVLGKTPNDRGRVVLRHSGGEEEIAVESDESRYLLGINRFNAAVLRVGQPACSGIDGIRSLAMVLAAEAAARTGKTTQISDAGLDLL